MKWYVTEYRGQTGMAIAGPFDSREEADDWHTEHHTKYRMCLLTTGPDTLGPTYEENLKAWNAKRELL